MTEILRIVAELADRLNQATVVVPVESIYAIVGPHGSVDVVVGTDGAVDVAWRYLDRDATFGIDEPATVSDNQFMWRRATARLLGVSIRITGPMHRKAA